MERRVLVGPGGAGKTEALWQHYRSLAGEDRTDSILVLLWNARCPDWRGGWTFWAGPLLSIHILAGQREIAPTGPGSAPGWAAGGWSRNS